MKAIQPLPPPDDFLAESQRLGIAFDPEDLEKLGLYLALLLETNRQFNLTSVREPREAWLRHIADSLTLIPFISSVHARTVIDIGSGGGLPGIPLAIVLPTVKYTLVEATGKKAQFLKDAVDQLSLPNVQVINDRAETLGRDREAHRERYDVVVARAVGKMPVLLELAIPLARIEGFVMAIKGERAHEEIAGSKEALYRLHSHVIDTRRTSSGTIVVIQKQRRTPKLYPRRPGEPKRAPLGGTSA